MQHFVLATVMLFFAVPFIPVIFILSFVCLPALFFMGTTFIVTSLVLPQALARMQSCIQTLDPLLLRNLLDFVVSCDSSPLQGSDRPGTTMPPRKPSKELEELSRNEQFLLIFKAFDLDDSGYLNVQEMTAAGNAFRGDGGWSTSKSIKFMERLGKRDSKLVSEQDLCKFLQDQTQHYSKEQVDNYVRRWVQAARLARTRKQGGPQGT